MPAKIIWYQIFKLVDIIRKSNSDCDTVISNKWIDSEKGADTFEFGFCLPVVRCSLDVQTTWINIHYFYKKMYQKKVNLRWRDYLFIYRFYCISSAFPKFNDNVYCSLSHFLYQLLGKNLKYTEDAKYLTRHIGRMVMKILKVKSNIIKTLFFVIGSTIFTILIRSHVLKRILNKETSVIWSGFRQSWATRECKPDKIETMS